MRVRLVFSADVKDTEDIRGLREQVGMCFEGLGDARLVGIFQVEDGVELKSERGKYGKVMLTDGGYEELIKRFGCEKVDEFIDRLSWKLHQKNYKFKDHYAVIVEWIEEEKLHPIGEARNAGSRGRLPLQESGNAQSFDVDEFYAAAVRGAIGDA